MIKAEIFDGVKTIPIYKPIGQEKFATRDLDDIGRMIMAKISTYAPLYLATKNAFPDTTDQYRQAFADRMFHDAVTALKEKFSSDPNLLNELEHVSDAYETNSQYKALYKPLVCCFSLPPGCSPADNYKISQKCNDFRNHWKEPLLHVVLTSYGLLQKLNAKDTEDVKTTVNTLLDRLQYTYAVRFYFLLFSMTNFSLYLFQDIELKKERYNLSALVPGIILYMLKDSNNELRRHMMELNEVNLPAHKLITIQFKAFLYTGVCNYGLFSSVY